MQKSDDFEKINTTKEFALKAVVKTYPFNLLFSIAIQYFNEGLMIMRMLAIKDMMTNYYKCEPQDLAYMELLAYLPWTCKFFYGLIVDVRLTKRKYYLIFFGIIVCGT